MYLIVGLGNPGEKYAHTHHNAGFDVVQLLANRLNISFDRLKGKARLAEGRLGGERVVLAQPQTFMNLSGESVVELVNWYKVDMEHLVVVYDDVDLEPGRIRFRAQGSAGTHNGMRSIIYLLGRDDFPRVRVGVGRAPAGWDLADWVLAGYRTPGERQTAYDSYLDACDVLEALVRGGADAASRMAAEKAARFAPKAAKNGRGGDSRSKYDFSDIAKHLNEKIAQKDIAGAACAVTIDGKMAWQGLFGLADVRSGRKITRDTMFRLASMTKPITGVAMMILKERGLVDFDAPVERYLPELAGMRVAIKDETGRVTGSEPLVRPITMRDLLTHSSGLGQETQSGVPTWSELVSALPESEYTLENIVKASAGALLDFQPGTKTGYSGVAAMNLLARIAEKVTGMSYAAFLSTEIFNPLGMGEITYLPGEHQWGRVAEVYEPGTQALKDIGRRGYDGLKYNYFCGSAGLVGTLTDYVRFTQMLVNGGELNGARVLSEQSVRELNQPQLRADLPGHQPGCNWGLSMRVTTVTNDEQPLPPGCYGWGGAYGTHFWIDPERRITAVCMIARAGGGSDIARQFEKDVMAAWTAGAKR